MIVPLSHVLLLSAILLVIGLVGFLIRRDAITVFLSVEIILNAANVAFIGFSRFLGDELGQVVAFVVIAAAAAEAAIGLALVVRLENEKRTLELDDLKDLKG